MEAEDAEEQARMAHEVSRYSRERAEMYWEDKEGVKRTVKAMSHSQRRAYALQEETLARREAWRKNAPVRELLERECGRMGREDKLSKRRVC